MYFYKEQSFSKSVYNPVHQHSHAWKSQNEHVAKNEMPVYSVVLELLKCWKYMFTAFTNKCQFYRSKQRRYLHKNEHDQVLAVSEVLTSLGCSARSEKLSMYRKSCKKVLSLDFQTREVWTGFEWRFNLTSHLNLSKMLNLWRFIYDYILIQA